MKAVLDKQVFEAVMNKLGELPLNEVGELYQTALQNVRVYEDDKIPSNPVPVPEVKDGA